MELKYKSSEQKILKMGVSIYAADKPDLAIDLNHQNFCWLMHGLGLAYTYESQSMLPSEVSIAVKVFRNKYCQIHSSDRDCSYRKLKVERWIGLLQAKRSPAPIMSEVADALGGKVVDLSPNWADLGDPFTPGTEAYRLHDQFMTYVRSLSAMSKYCAKSNQAILVN